MKMHLFKHYLRQLLWSGSAAWWSCNAFENHLGILLSMRHGTRFPWFTVFKNALLLAQIRSVHRNMLMNSDDKTVGLLKQLKHLFPPLEIRDPNAVQVAELAGLRKDHQLVFPVFEQNEPQVRIYLKAVEQCLGRVRPLQSDMIELPSFNC